MQPQPAMVRNTLLLKLAKSPLFFVCGDFF